MVFKQNFAKPGFKRTFFGTPCTVLDIGWWWWRSHQRMADSLLYVMNVLIIMLNVVLLSMCYWPPWYHCWWSRWSSSGETMLIYMFFCLISNMHNVAINMNVVNIGVQGGRPLGRPCSYSSCACWWSHCSRWSYYGETMAGSLGSTASGANTPTSMWDSWS